MSSRKRPEPECAAQFPAPKRVKYSSVDIPNSDSSRDIKTTIPEKSVFDSDAVSRIGVMKKEQSLRDGNVNSHPPFPKFEIPNNSPQNISTLRKTPSIPFKLPFSVLKVTNSEDSFAEFSSRWKQQSRYAVGLIYIPQQTREVDQQKLLPCHDPKLKTKTDLISGMADEDSLFLADRMSIIGLVVAWDASRCYFIKLQEKIASEGAQWEDVECPSTLKEKKIQLLMRRWKTIKKVLEMEDTEKILFDSKPQIKLLLSRGVNLVSGIRDPRISSWILDPDHSKDCNLRLLFQKYAPIHSFSNDYYTHQHSVSSTVQDLDPGSKAARSCLISVHQSLLISHLLEQELKSSQQYDLYVNMEMMLVPILAKLEFFGVGFSTETLLASRDLIERKISNLRNRAYKSAGKEFDLDSPSEVADILFEHLKLPYPHLDEQCEKGNPTSHSIGYDKEGKVRKKRIEKSTRAEVLEAMQKDLKNPNKELPSIVLEHRTLQHTINNYLDPLPMFCFFSKETKMTRIFSTCHQTCVPTGRLAFDHPNLQSIRHAFEFVPVNATSLNPKLKQEPTATNQIPSPAKSTPHSSSSSSPSLDMSSSNGMNSTPLGSPLEINIRDSFVAADGMQIVSFDYCQLELRIMAHFAQDLPLINKLSDTSIDMFKVIASQWLEKPLESITAEERVKTKSICYGILYGMGTTVLSRMLQVIKSEAKEFRMEFERKFSGLSKFLNNCIEETRNRGYSLTIGGRRRHFPDIYITPKNDTDRQDLNRAKRQITNTVCQGSASDIVKTAAVNIELLLRSVSPQSRLIINLHDELVYELPTEQLADLIPKIRAIMENSIKLSLPLPVRVFVGSSWGHLSSWNEE